MITNSNPFLRNDYYPDQNDIDALNTRINEVQSDVDLLAISVNEKTEAVNGRLNNLQDDYNESFETEALKANTADLNVLNVNVQATIKDLNAENTYTENLIVNKPVQDLALRTPHLENTTSLNGNFYAPNILGGELDNVKLKNIQNFNAVNIEANEVKANKLIGDFSAEPISSSAVVGYDENGQLIPIRASYDISFPEDADYLKTDNQGIARKGTSESEVVQSTNLIQAGAVQNMYDAVNANFNNVSDSFNTVENTFNNTFNNFANSLNDMNMVVNNIESNVNNIESNVNNIESNVNNIESNVNNIESNVNNIESNVKTINDFIFNDIYIPEYGSFNTTSPVEYRNATTVELYGNAQGGNAIPNGGGLIKFDSSTNKVTFGFSGACRGIKDANGMFAYCFNLNQNIAIPNSVEIATNSFYRCNNLNQNIAIPNSVKNCSYMFALCYNLNQNIAIPNSVEGASNMFEECWNLNQNIIIPNSVKNCIDMFSNCYNLNQSIAVPNSVKDISDMFKGCINLNQSIAIPNSVEECNWTFKGCVNLNQNIIIPNSVKNCSYMFDNCSSLNQSIAVPNSVTDCRSMFRYCGNLNQDIYLYFQNIYMMDGRFGEEASVRFMFLNTKVNLHNIHIPSSVPKDTSNNLYNCLVNNATGVTFAPENIINDLPVDPVVWPPVD